MAAAVLQDMGFKNIKNINGAMNALKAAELAVYTPSKP
jgi:rhodanese-related sulfurtransferase